MTVDLETLKTGAVVHFRSGGEAVVERANDCGDYTDIKLKGSMHGGMCWFHNGCFDDEESETDPFDIVKITTPAFDWDTIKWGMTFKWDAGGDSVFTYLGRDIKGHYVMQRDEFNTFHAFSCPTTHLTRIREKDRK